MSYSSLNLFFNLSKYFGKLLFSVEKSGVLVEVLVDGIILVALLEFSFAVSEFSVTILKFSDGVLEFSVVVME